MAITDRSTIANSLTAFQSRPLKEAARQFLETLGYRSDRSLAGSDSSPRSFLELFSASVSERAFDQDKALVAEWKTADFLFQITDQELSHESSLFTDTSVAAGMLKSYVFIAIELKESNYARGEFSAIARQINRIFPMPVMVFFKHHGCLTIAVINRRVNKVDESKDVLGKVTLIREIEFAKPHPGHLDILASLALPNLVHPQKKPITDFDTLHASWEQIFNIELLNERFYRELANWYFWALPQVEFPADLEPDSEKRRATSLIRLLTRLIFCWFLKEKDLIPEKLFHPTDLAKVLDGFDPESETSSTYYQAILQNLFFATLNQRMGKDVKGQPHRRYVTPEDFHGKNKEHGITNLLRYPEHFRFPNETPALFEDIPFLNGGLFECLDREDPDDKNRMKRLDGFTTKGVRPMVPNLLFFGEEHEEDLSGRKAYNDPKRKKERVSGLIRILNSYKFTIVENTPIDQEIALDPELLGKVFENLLASYNEETKTTARKQTGSFYTPRPIVDYMVDESLKFHLTRTLVDKAGMKESDACASLGDLFAYTEKKHLFSEAQVAVLITAIDALKILDPACGSGAFPMGVLHKLVYILGKIDPKNERWEQIRIDEAQKIAGPEERRKRIAEIVSNFQDNNDDYGRKLYLIENCLYGVDIQPIAIQITKLRFFISLVCDQKTNRNKKENHGIRPLPNLETKFVAADALIGLPELEQMALAPKRAYEIEAEIESIYHNHFSEQRRDRKLANQRKVKNLRQELAKVLAESLMAPKKAQHIADWDAFDPQSSADFFDPHWMFGRSLANGFDIVIGNPPYVSFYSRHSQGVDEDYLAHLTSQASFIQEPLAGKRFHTAMFFIDRAIRLSATNGLVTYIVDMNLFERVFAGVRQYLLKKTKIIGVVRGLSDFENVNSGQVVLSFLISPPAKGDSFLLKNGLDDVGEPVSQFACLADEQCRLVLPRTDDFFEDCLKLSEIGTVSTGVNIGGASNAFLSSQRVSRDYLPFISTTTIRERYQQVIHHGEFINFSQQLVEHINSENRARGSKNVVVLGNIERFKGEKIFIRQSAPAIIATYDDQISVAPYSIFVFKINSHQSKVFPLKFLLAVLNSSVITSYALNHQIIRTGEGKQPQIRKSGLDTLPIKKPLDGETDLFEQLVTLIQFAKAQGQSAPGAFLEDLIDACVMECYFREHMAERDLLFHQILAPHLTDYDPKAGETKKREFLTNLYQTLNAPSHAIRNRLLRLTADSPDLLAVIKEEGRV